MQILLRSELTQFLSSLELTKRYADPIRAQQVRECLTPGLELVIQVAEYYRKVYPERCSTRLETKRREKEFFAEHCHIMVAHEDSRPVGGFIVLGDELLALHSKHRGKGDWLMQHAVNLGAKRLDCFAVPQVVELYERYGFKAVETALNWEPGGLNVHKMEREV